MPQLGYGHGASGDEAAQRADLLSSGGRFTHSLTLLTTHTTHGSVYIAAHVRIFTRAFGSF